MKTRVVSLFAYILVMISFNSIFSMQVPDRCALAAQDGNMHEVHAFVTGGGNVNSHNRVGFSLLHTAAWNGYVDMADYLIANGANIDNPAGDGQNRDTPLLLAASVGNFRMVRYFVERRSDLDYINNQERTALHMATIGEGQEYSAIMRYLVNRGLNLEARDREGRTPLLVASHIIARSKCYRLIGFGCEY